MKATAIGLYSEPLEIERGNQIFDVYVGECQGFGKDKGLDARLFALASQLSSLMIYNQVGDVNFLELDFVRELKIKDTKEFPELLWLLRDFEVDEPDAYFEDKLNHGLSEGRGGQIYGSESVDHQA